MNFKYFGAMLAMAAMSLLCAAPVTLDLTANVGVGTYGNVLTYTSGPVTATVTSWTLLTNGATFTKSATGRWSGGLGVCNTSETTTNCASPNHTMDNYAGNDFILFQFNSAVDPLSLTLNAFGSPLDSDLSYWTGNTAFSTSLLVGKTLAGLAGVGFGAEQQNLTSAGASTRTANLTSGNVNSLLLAANLANIDHVMDYIKVGSLTASYTTPQSTVPEPATMGLLGVALLGLGALRMRRRG